MPCQPRSRLLHIITARHVSRRYRALIGDCLSVVVGEDMAEIYNRSGLCNDRLARDSDTQEQVRHQILSPPGPCPPAIISSAVCVSSVARHPPRSPAARNNAQERAFRQVALQDYTQGLTCLGANADRSHPALRFRRG